MPLRHELFSTFPIWLSQQQSSLGSRHIKDEADVMEEGIMKMTFAREGGREWGGEGRTEWGGEGGREYWILDCCFWNTAPALSTGFPVLSHAHTTPIYYGRQEAAIRHILVCPRPSGRGQGGSIAKMVCIGVDPLVYPRPICPCPEVRA